MSAAVDRTRWSPRPVPRTLEEIAAIARRSGRPLHAQIELPEGWANVYFEGCVIRHAAVGWALGRRALRRLVAAEPFVAVHLDRHAVPDTLTLERPWAQLRAELAWSRRFAPPRA